MFGWGKDTGREHRKSSTECVGGEGWGCEKWQAKCEQRQAKCGKRQGKCKVCLPLPSCHQHRKEVKALHTAPTVAQCQQRANRRLNFIG